MVRSNRSKQRWVRCTWFMVAVSVLCLVSNRGWLVKISMAQSSSTPASAEVTPRVNMSPNMLVSRDGDIPHVELMVAANPTNVKNLLGAAITNTRPDGGWACKTYASLDGGNSWTASAFPEQMEWGGGDPQVAFGTHGTAYFTALTFERDDAGRMHGYLLVYRSEDGGIHWKSPAGLGYSYDHEQIVIDRTFGRFAGRVYIGVLHGYPVYRVGIFRSDDDGRTFTGPVDAASGEGKVGINVTNLLVMSDGTLFVPYSDFDFKPEQRKDNRPSVFWFVTSSDGGITFSKPTRIHEQRRTPDMEMGRVSTFPVYAVDNQTDKYRDRLYIAWNDFRFGKPRILFSYSTDRGKSWTDPRILDPSVPESAIQYQPMMVVNSQGVVGVTWFDTRDSSDGRQYNEYFSASIDGGATFSPAARVSSETSNPDGPGNLTTSPLFSRLSGSLPIKGPNRISLISAASRWGQGGDYMGLAADLVGTFHPFWADSRTGTFQVRTAALQVEVPSGSGQRGTSQPINKSPEIKKVLSDVTDKIDLVFDPTRYDAATNIVEIPIRLRNISQQTIFAPISVTIEGFGSGMGSDLKELTPAVVNASNGETGDGATFNYSQALGSADGLAPAAESGEVMWKLKVKDPKRIPDMHIVIKGEVASKE